jgi:tRNA modification GTPase
MRTPMVDTLTTRALLRSRAPIFVRVTGAGAGGIATLVLDGEQLNSLLQPFFKAKRSLFEAVSGDLLFGRLVDPNGRLVDEVIAAPLGKKNSSTGNDQIELSCHGGIGALAVVEQTLRDAGFENGGDTTLLERAHLNGKLSLIAAESRLRLAQAVTARQADFLLAHREFQSAWERHGFEMALAMRTKAAPAWREKMFADALAALQQSGPARQLLKQHHVAILGPVNAGKSTLANALAQADRHIVSDIPGTTLDRLDTPIELRGLNVLLSDTAGLRGVNSEVEREGQSRAMSAAHTAALRLLVLDGSRAPSESDVEWITLACASGPSILVLNKSDLGCDENTAGLSFIVGSDAVQISAQSGAGISKLAESIEAALLKGAGPQPGAPFTHRQAGLLDEMRSGLNEGAAGGVLLPLLRRLVGVRPDEDELNVVLAE